MALYNESDLKLPFFADIKRLRKKYDMNQQQAAKLFGVPYPTYNAWENDNRNPSASGVRLLEIFKVMEAINEQTLKALIEIAKQE